MGTDDLGVLALARPGAARPEDPRLRGTQSVDVAFADINGSIRASLPGAQATFPQYVNDTTGRVYLGANLFGAPQDRVEAVQFPDKGTFLVICAFVPHFLDNMHGWVKVV